MWCWLSEVKSSFPVSVSCWHNVTRKQRNVSRLTPVENATLMLLPLPSEVIPNSREQIRFWQNIFWEMLQRGLHLVLSHEREGSGGCKETHSSSNHRWITWVWLQLFVFNQTQTSELMSTYGLNLWVSRFKKYKGSPRCSQIPELLRMNLIVHQIGIKYLSLGINNRYWFVYFQSACHAVQSSRKFF